MASCILTEPSGHLGKLLPASEAHRDGAGKTIRNNVLNFEDKIHRSMGASVAHSTTLALKELWGREVSPPPSGIQILPEAQTGKRVIQE